MDILASRLDQVETWISDEFGKGRYHSLALYREIFKKGNPDFSGAAEFERSPALVPKMKPRVAISPGRVSDVFEDDGLTKFITCLEDDEQIESVIIPMTGRNTLCVSSQVGCRMGCRFCRTGRMGLHRNLTVSEITGQLFNARFTLGQSIKNVVFMGMGEPFDNFDNVIQAIRIMNEQRGFDIALRHITVSTAGLSEQIEKLGRRELKGLRLAVSINAADDAVRSRLMPVNRKIPLARLRAALAAYPLTSREGFLFEYILIKGLNDSEEDAEKLAAYIGELPVRLNLIAYNPVEGFNYESPSDDQMYRFSDILTRQGVFVVKRWSKGRSVGAGCGQLGKRGGKTPSGIV